MKFIIKCHRKDQSDQSYIKFTNRYESSRDKKNAMIFASLKYTRKIALEFNIGKNGFDYMFWEATIIKA